MKKNALILLAVITFLGCSKNDDGPKLPPVTQMGANTFGCYIDGNLLVPRSGTGTFNSPDYGMVLEAGPGPGDNVLYHELKVYDYKSGNGARFTLHILGLLDNGVGTYAINESNCEGNILSNQNTNLFCRWWNENTQTYKWYCSVENGGALEVLRNDNGILSGTFNSRMVNRDDPTEFIEITEGRFDINGYTLLDKYFP